MKQAVVRQQLRKKLWAQVVPTEQEASTPAAPTVLKRKKEESGDMENTCLTKNVTIEKILSTKQKYENLLCGISIDKNCKDYISLLSGVGNTSMSQILNNIVTMFIRDKRLMKELEDFGMKKINQLK